MKLTAWLIAVVAAVVLYFPWLATDTIGVAISHSLQWLSLPVLWLSSGFLLLCLALLVSPWGSYRLGSTGEIPEFGTLSWLSMLFAAGMGSGLVFWGVGEPLTHLAIPPIENLNPARAKTVALAVTHFHWGFHAWAIYAVAGLSVAWFSYRFGAPESPSGALQSGLAGWLSPVSCRRLGLTANTLAVVAVVFGVAGALANGTILLRNGLGNASGIEISTGFSQGMILLIMTVAFLASASSGIRQGIRWLSAFNMVLAIALMTILFVVGNTAEVLELFWLSAAAYAELLLSWSWSQPLVAGSFQWSEGWTINYLLWWIAWAPFVGIFIARISRGRTVRSYIFGVLFVPVMFSMMWFTVLGGGAMIWDQQHGGFLLEAVTGDYTRPLFLWFSGLNDTAGSAAPAWGSLLSWVACILLFVFLVTSADSAAYVLGMLSNGGDPNPPNRSKFLWGSLTVLLAAGLLLRDSADVNKTLSIAGAIPYAVLLLLQVVAWGRSFTNEIRRQDPD